MKLLRIVSTTTIASASFLLVPDAYAISEHASDRAKQVLSYWTAERKAAAVPRDIVVDEKGGVYFKRARGVYDSIGNAEPIKRGKPTATIDTEPPTIQESSLVPLDGETIGSDKIFEAVVTDDSGRPQSVDFVISAPSGVESTYSASYYRSLGKWAISFTGFSDGCGWSWHVSATDKSGNTSTSSEVNFDVDTDNNVCTGTGTGTGGTGSNNSSDVVANQHWTFEGPLVKGAGRIYFEMPTNSRKKRWNGYVCSGTVADDGSKFDDRSVIITAAHCVYDDVTQSFARNVVFIPDQDGTTGGSSVDGDCSNDPMGCWAPAFGVVDENWTNQGMPANFEWDYAYYVVDNINLQSIWNETQIASLESEAGAIPITFADVSADDGTAAKTSIDFTYALGYSYTDDPFFMFCAEDMTASTPSLQGLSSGVNWWLSTCGLSGGASGGPWVQNMTYDDSGKPTDNGPIMSVNSWGLVNSITGEELPGMAGPRLVGTSAECLFEQAKDVSFDTVSVYDLNGDAGVIVTDNQSVVCTRK